MSELIDTLSSRYMSADEAKGVYDSLADRYHEPWRRYHRSAHLSDVTNYLIKHIDELEDPRVTLWAAIGHDAIYIPQVSGGVNEEMSAQLTSSMLLKYMSGREAFQIGDYIRATANHEPGDDHDLAHLLDADLKILGSDTRTFEYFEYNIREEYRHFDDRAFALGRRAVLQDFLDRQRIYITDTAHREFEQPARQNLTNAIAKLSERLEQDG